MKRFFSGLALAVAGLLVVGLTNFGSDPVNATPSMGSNCAACHGSNIPGTTTTKPTTTTTTKPTTTTTTKPATTTTKPATTTTTGGACAKCHPKVKSPMSGMSCETCHSGGAAHMKAPTKVKVKATLQGAQTCASCHKGANKGR